jgi:methionyl-tRNA formyltransferase
MRIVFAGTPKFAVPALQRLIDTGAKIAAVYTQPDRRAGRGRRLRSSPVKLLALEHGLAVVQPATLNEEGARMEGFEPDVVVVVAYGQILPTQILDLPKLGCLNVHASLLPRWRGAAPIARAIEAGDRTTGVTLMQMDSGLDTGAIIANSTIEVDQADDSASLHDKLANLGADLLVRSLPAYVSGELKPVAQDNRAATYAPKLSKSEAGIDWSGTATDIRNKIRAFNPWPVAHTRHRGNRLRILQAEIGNADDKRVPQGTICRVDKSGVEVVCGDGVLRLTRLQRDDGRALAAGDFINGYPLQRGETLQ